MYENAILLQKEKKHLYLTDLFQSRKMVLHMIMQSGETSVCYQVVNMNFLLLLEWITCRRVSTWIIVHARTNSISTEHVTPTRKWKEHIWKARHSSVINGIHLQGRKEGREEKGTGWRVRCLIDVQLRIIDSFLYISVGKRSTKKSEKKKSENLRSLHKQFLIENENNGIEEFVTIFFLLRNRCHHSPFVKR